VKALERTASALVVLGVTLMILASRLVDSHRVVGPFIIFSLGAIALNLGVRVAIDVARVSR
jgi:hypothetical protein